MSSRKSHLYLLVLIFGALVAAILLAVPGSPIHRKPRLGLDLQGGLEVILKAVPPKGHTLTSSDLTLSRDIIERRVNGLGISETNVVTQPPNEIVIQLPGVRDPAKAASIIGKTAQLQIFDFETAVTGPSKSARGPVVTATLYQLLTKAKPDAARGSPEAYYLFKSKSKQVPVAAKKGSNRFKTTKPKTKTVVTHSLVAGPDPRLADLLQPYRGKVPKGYEVLATPQGTEAVSQQGGAGWFLLKLPPSLAGNQLDLGSTRADIDPQNNQWVVLLGFKNGGSKAFQKITKAEYERGRTSATLAGQIGNTDVQTVQTYAGHSAIVLDNVIQSMPYIDYTDGSLSQGISGGAQISMGNSGSAQSDAKNLALVLQTGSLPVNFVQVERTDVSSTLGKDSLRQAWHAAVVGLVVVAIFLLFLYRFLGLVAVIGLAIYAALYYAAILLFGVTLTLPGFAGLILTIGVAADANVVVFERIKEEVRAGKSVRAAIAAGYGKGFHTILDANVVTAITALVLFAVATAEVKGFALMLLIGTVISLITAVAATRALLGVLAGFRWFNNARFMGAQGTQRAKWLQIDFMKRRNTWFAISGVFIVVGAIALGIKGLNLGIDFKGGTQVSFTTQQPTSISDVRKQTAAIGYGDAIVQGRGVLTGSDSYKEFQIRLKSLSGDKQTQLTRDLQQNVDATKLGIKNVSASFGRQIARDAILAIIVSLALIVIYIAIRFDFKFALPVIIAMLHDIAITIGIYALVGREVSTATVAAVLTVLGYSIYDTIIIFDRVRENVPLMRRAPFATIANVSLWETIRRSLATTFITLLPVAALLIFGGATLKDFAFALLIGITSGAYSSIFIAAPLLTMWKEREPEYARRKDQGPDLEAEAEPAGDGRPSGRFRRGRPALDEGSLALLESEQALASEPTPDLLDIVPEPAPAAPAGSKDRREQRRQRRRTRPHGRAR